MILSGCQGKPQPGIIEIECPNCGELVEMATTDAVVICDECGEPVINERMSCLFWCDKARECIGEEAYEAAMAVADKIDFDPEKFKNFTRW